MRNVDSYLDSLLSEFTNPKTLSKAKQLVQTKSQKVFDDLDSKNLLICNQQVHLDLEFRSQSAKHPLPTRKIDCFGRSEEKSLTNEEIQSLRKERAQRAQQKLKQLQEASENRKQELIKAWKITQELKNHKPLFQLIQEQEQAHLKQQSEELQKKLEQIRQERRPLTKKDFEEHRKNFCDIVIKPRNHSVDLHNLNTEKSHYHMIIEQEKNKFILLEKERKCKQLELINKKKQFSEQIKSQFKPKLSLEKREELQELQSKLSHKPDFKQYQMLANKVRAKKVLYQLQDTDEETSSLINCIKSKDQNTSYDLASQDTQMPKFKHKSFAYENNSFQSSINQWQKVALSKKISYQEKNTLIIDQAKKLEQMSMKQEQLARVQGQESIEADNLLISSIKAKLTVLEN